MHEMARVDMISNQADKQKNLGDYEVLHHIACSDCSRYTN